MRPAPEGYGTQARVEREMQAHALKISASATLADLAKEYAIFTHAPFFVHGKLDVDPVADYVAKHPDPDVMAMPATFGRRLFRGLSALGRTFGPPLDWPATLIFVRLDHWPGLFDHLRCCGWIDRQRRLYGRAVVQALPIVDFLALDRLIVAPVVLPTVTIAAFGVDATHDHVQFAPRGALPGDLPTAVHLPLVPATRALGDALLSCDPRPFRFVESEDPLAGQEGVVPPPA